MQKWPVFQRFCIGLLMLAAASLSPATCPPGDLNNDCRVNLADLTLLAEHWLTAAPEANINQDNVVNLKDYELLSAGWLKKANRLIISEFLASNKNVLDDEEGQASDWIELYNMTPEPIPLLGWYLTDKADELTKWAFPDVTLDSGDVRVVFASGQDRRDPAAPLHTNFSLAAEGEYLALVGPDGTTIVHAYKPAFPKQLTDISYGVPITGHSDTLVTGGAAGRILIPAASDALPADWNTAAFDDSQWQTAVMGVGYDTSSWGATPENLALGKPAAQSSSYSASYPAANAVDGALNTFSHTASLDTNAAWRVDLGGDYYISQIILYNRLNCCWPRLRDITVSIRDPQDTMDLFVSDLLNPENILDSPTFLTVDLSSSPVLGGIVKIHRTPDPDLSGNGGIGSDTDRNALTLAEVEVLGSLSLNNAYSTLIQTNVRNAMQSRNSSIFMRIPFSIAADRQYDYLYFKGRYDDGFAAYLNGVLVAQRNAPAALAWNAAAAAEHPKPEAILYETINLTPHVSLLRPGNNVLAIHGLNTSAADEDFLMDVELTGVAADCGPAGYFKQPTPGQVNGVEAFTHRVADTRFSAHRGYYDEPFEVIVSTDTEGATIYYTTDGSTPSPENGTVYTAPIRIAKTTCLRAVAVKSGYLSTNVDTQTYLFPENVIHQPSQPEGFPTSWKTVAADYEIDPDIVNSPAYSGQLRDALLSLPVISLVTDLGNLFDSTYGIYANPNQFAFPTDDGSLKWEVPVSMEYFETGDGKQIQVDCGLRIQGGYFRSPTATPKHSFRLLFKRDYGPGKLDIPLFDDNNAASRFDTIVLRAQGNDGYSWASMGGKAQYIRDEFGRRMQSAAGHAAAHGLFVHLYVNGLYWGLYNAAERPDSAFSAAYYGGKKEDWDVFKHKNLELSEGTRDALDAMLNLCRVNTTLGAVTLSNSEYWKLQGCNPDGTRNPVFPVLLDMDNYITYMLVNFWNGNQDWGWNDNNYWLGRSRRDDSTGFKFYCWDIEDTLDSPRSPLTLDMIAKVYANDKTIGRIHNRLMSNAEYRLRFADHAHKHLFNNGRMTAGPAIALYRQLADQVESAIIAESARWGDQHSAAPWTQAHWRAERDYILNTYLPQRPAVVLQQLKYYGLYPAAAAPIFRINGAYQHGGKIAPSAVLTMASPDSNAAVWFTLNGTDPRQPGGQVAPDAVAYTAPVTLTASQTVNARSLSQGQWSALNQAAYTVVPVLADGPVVISEIMYHPPAGGEYDKEEYEFIELCNISAAPVALVESDGGEPIPWQIADGIQFTFPPDASLSAGRRIVVVRNLAAFQSRHPDVPSEKIFGPYTGKLDNAGETIDLLKPGGEEEGVRQYILVERITYSDGVHPAGDDPWPTQPDGGGMSLTRRNDTLYGNDAANWQAAPPTPGY